jgi:hypothetical protein
MATRSGWRRGRHRLDSDDDDDTDLLRVWTRGGHQSELQREGNKPVQEKGRGVVGTHRISEILPAAMADSGEKILKCWWRFERGKGGGKGEERVRILMEPSDGHFYARGVGKVGAWSAGSVTRERRRNRWRRRCQ